MLRASHRRLVALVSTLFALSLAHAGIGVPRALALPPALTVPGSQTVPEFQPLAFTVTATDPEGQLCDLRASNLPGGASFTDNRNNTGSFDWTPDGFAAGVYSVYFTADDTFGGRTTRSVSIEVTNANGLPVLDPIADRTLDPGSMAFLMVYGYDPDGDPLTLWATGMPSFGSLSDNGDGTGTIALAPSLSQPGGSWPVTVSLSDGSNTVSQGFTVTVTGAPPQHAPTLDPVADQTVAEGAAQAAVLTASDVDGDALIWTSALPGFAGLAPGPGGTTATLSMNPGYCAAGAYGATVGVSDGALSAQRSFNITVTDVPRAPAWTGGPYSLALVEGSSSSLDVTSGDPDQACGAAPAALAIAGSTAGPALALALTDNGDGTGRLSVTAGAGTEGSHVVTLRATDSANPSLTVDAAVAVTVTHLNRAPVADAGGPYAGIPGVAVEMSGAGSSDPDGDALTFAWTFGDGASGAGAGVTHAYEAPGTYEVTLTVGDGTLTGTDGTTATIEAAGRPLEARAWIEPRTVHLHRGKATERVYLEPVGDSFDLANVLLSSVTLTTSSGAGRVGSVAPVLEKTRMTSDRDGNGVQELLLQFREDDLAALCSFVDRRMAVTFTLSAALATGGEVQATFTAEVVMQKKRAIRQVGPNPLNPAATVTLDVSRAGTVRLRVYDLNGRLVRTLHEGEATAGQTLEVLFDGHDAAGRPLASGRYFIRAELPDVVETSSITILK